MNCTRCGEQLSYERPISYVRNKNEFNQTLKRLSNGGPVTVELIDRQLGEVYDEIERNTRHNTDDSRGMMFVAKKNSDLHKICGWLFEVRQTLEFLCYGGTVVNSSDKYGPYVEVR